MAKQYISTFNSGIVGFAEFGGDPEVIEANGIATLTKPALILIEGNHIDSKNNRHVFSKQRIYNIVQKTNDFMNSGGRVPFQRDHQKDTANNIGDLEGPLEIKVITEADLPDSRLKHLIGKVGVFTRHLVAKGSEIVQDILSKKVKTISPGIEIATDIIREISSTPTPAIVGPALFSRSNNNNNTSMENYIEFGSSALSFDEAEQEQQDLTQLRQAFDELCDTFWTVATNIQGATEEMLQGNDPSSLMQQAISDFGARIASTVGLDDGSSDQQDPAAAQDPYAQQQQQMQQQQPPYGGRPGPMPGYLPQQQDVNAGQPAQYSMNKNAIASFRAANPLTLRETELATFGIFGGQQMPGQRPKKQGLSTGAKVGIGVGAAAGVAGGARLAQGAIRGVKRAGAGAGFGAKVSAAASGAVKQAGHDVRRAGGAIGGLGSKIAGAAENPGTFGKVRKAVGGAVAGAGSGIGGLGKRIIKGGM